MWNTTRAGSDFHGTESMGRPSGKHTVMPAAVPPYSSKPNAFLTAIFTTRAGAQNGMNHDEYSSSTTACVSGVCQYVSLVPFLMATSLTSNGSGSPPLCTALCNAVRFTQPHDRDAVSLGDPVALRVTVADCVTVFVVLTVVLIVVVVDSVTVPDDVTVVLAVAESDAVIVTVIVVEALVDVVAVNVVVAVAVSVGVATNVRVGVMRSVFVCEIASEADCVDVKRNDADAVIAAVDCFEMLPVRLHRTLLTLGTSDRTDMAMPLATLLMYVW